MTAVLPSSDSQDNNTSFRLQKREKSLRYKATVFAIALGTLPVFITSSIAYYMASRAVVKQITEEQTVRAELASSQVNTFLISRTRDLDALATNLLLSDSSLQASTQQKQETVENFFAAMGYFDSIILFDVEGNPVVQANEGNDYDGNYGDRGYFQAAVKTRQTTMNGPGLSSSSGKLRVEFAVPVIDRQTDEILYIIRARVPGQHLNILFRDFEDTGDGWYLVNDSGLLFAGSAKEFLGHPISEYLPGLVDLIAKGKSGTDIYNSHALAEDAEHHDHTEIEPGAEDLEADHSDELPEADHSDELSSVIGSKEVVSYVPVELGDELPPQNMGLVVYTDTEVSLAPQRHLALVFAVGTVLTALISAAIATILAKRLSTPIKNLTDTARTIAQEGRFDLRVPVTSQDELGSLANSFNQLVEWVGLRTQDLEASQLDLEQRTQELTAIINSLGDGLLVTDETGKIARVNPPLLRMFNQSTGDMQGRYIRDVFDADLNELIEKTHQNGDVLGSEVALANNSIGQALVSTIFDLESGNALGTVVLIRDVTAEKEVDRMKTDFISTVSHELRTPLTSVLGFAKIIQKKLETTVLPAVVSEEKKTKRAVRQVTDNLKIIVSEGERLTSLINDVLDIAKIEAGKIEWRMAEVEPHVVVEQAIAATSVLAQTHNISLSADIAPDLPTITADQDRLIQVLINLISNAVKFTPEGTVTCEVKCTEDELRISVIDTGMGISEEDQPKVFEKFKQVGEIMTDKPQGTGLGLPICKQIVEHHGGRIWVESRLGTGSTFSVGLPLVASSTKTDSSDNLANYVPSPTVPSANTTVQNLVRQLKADVKQTTPASAGVPKTILVVDDEANIRRLLRQELETEGYRVQEAENGLTALEAIKKSRPDLVITDVMMPMLDGFDLAAVLKTNPDTANIPTIILSIVEDRDRGFGLGVDGYLTKPINIGVLLSDIDSLLTHKETRSKVLVVNRDASASKTLTEVLLTKGYVVAAASSGQEGLDKARSIKPDMMIVEAELSQKHNIVKTLRFEKGLENISVILIESIEKTALSED